MPKVLLEIGLEEVPARFVDQCLSDIKTALIKQLQGARLTTDTTQVDALGTYRRFAFVIHDILNEQVDIDEALDGPPLSIAKSDAGEWLAPAIGFAKKCGVSLDELNETTNSKGQAIVCANKFQQGQSAVSLLPTVFQSAVLAMKLPIAMVWGNNVGPFIRPIKWVCAMMDHQVIDWEFFGVSASNTSLGHRFLSASTDASSGEVLSIAHPDDYIDTLRKANVVVDVEERKALIRQQLSEKISDIDEGLLNEVTHLVEWPTALSIPFSNDFLALPKEVLTQCLKKHQKAFMVTEMGELKNECVVIADSVTPDNQHQIIEGNQRVMLARLNDVQFFWDEDLKNHGFANWNEKLNGIVFQEGLGSIADKVERVSHIAHTIMDQLDIDKDMRDIVDRAAHRAKADLVSQMVNELPSLQGIMGAYYAMIFKEEPDVIVAIRDHYRPRFEGDDFPETIPGVIIAISDRLDTMVACFENNAIPTGSRDPWGIRRSMIAIMRMIIHFKLNINIELLLEDATLTLEKKIGENTAQCRDFFKTRIETVFLEHHIPPDMVQLFQDKLLSDPLTCFEKALALISLKKSSPKQYQLLLETTARVSKIIDGFQGESRVSNQLFEHDIESAAFQSFQLLKEKSKQCILNAGDIDHALSFCETLSDYFEQVLINAENPEIANNRRSFIKSVNDYFFTVGDWLKLQK